MEETRNDVTDLATQYGEGVLQDGAAVCIVRDDVIDDAAEHVVTELAAQVELLLIGHVTQQETVNALSVPAENYGGTEDMKCARDHRRIIRAKTGL